MTFSLPELFLIGVTYLLFLFGTAYLTERGVIGARLVKHPLVHMLSLGVYASVWTFYGAFGLAQQGGYTFLVSYLGATAAFILAPAIMVPILRITRTHQLSSLADLFAFRFRSGFVGTVTSLLLVAATLPLISIQIQAVTDSLRILNGRFSSELIASGFCTIIAMFSILFGARHASLRNRNRGLVVAMAVESLIKLLALVVIALYAFFVILEGPSGLDSWLSDNPYALDSLHVLPSGETWRTLLLAFFAATFVMPHMFHLAYTENHTSESLYKATWGMPLYLMVLAICVLPILWAGMKIGADYDPEFVLLHLGMAIDSDMLTMLAFIGGLSAASGIIIVATVSMASMLQNHLILPLVEVPDNVRFYAWLLWLRRMLIIGVLLCSYFYYVHIGSGHELHLLGLVAFVAFLHFLPGLLATLFWARANRWGFLTGLISGMAYWLSSMLFPMFYREGAELFPFDLATTGWQEPAALSLILNAGLLILVSMLIPATRDEEKAANACMQNVLQNAIGQQLSATRTEDFEALLTPRLGKATAEREVQRALSDLSISRQELSPLELIRLRTELENNLSGLLGPVEAATILEPLDQQDHGEGFQAREVNLLESQLENYYQRLSGVAVELDDLRRLHRLTLQKMPVGVCTLDKEGKILFWNSEMERYTNFTADEALTKSLASLPAPWDKLLHDFASSDLSHKPSDKMMMQGEPRWFSLHKTELNEKDHGGMVILLEDETDTLLLADKLSHSERLASIGRFAAGVAHEIGNPVTGIACLAQNLKLETEHPEILETGDEIVEQTKRISRIVQSLVRFAHSGQGENTQPHERLNLSECISEAIHLVSLDSRGKYQQYQNDTASELWIMGDPQQLIQVFVNLLNNACDASPENAKIWISCERAEESIVINITDEGEGIPAELQDRLFEPFFTTKEPGKGTGLGLPLVYNIIEEHYGNIEIFSPAKNNQNKGTQVVITLPALLHCAESDR